MKKLLQFFVIDDWTQVFSWTNKKVQLFTEEYIIALEILQEAESIPHGFRSLLFNVFYDNESKGLKKMWDPEFAQRTAKAIQPIFQKALENKYLEGSEPHLLIENGLENLRKIQIDYTDYEACKGLYKKIELLYEKDEAKKWAEIGELVDSWYN